MSESPNCLRQAGEWQALARGPLREMDDTETKTLATLFLAERDKSDDIEMLWAKCASTPTLRILVGHLEGLGVNYDKMLALFCSTLTGRPGRLVLWAWTIAHLNYSIGRTATLSDFAEGPFAYGVPTDAAYDDAWDELKSMRAAG